MNKLQMMVEDLMRYESDDLEEAEVVALFQHLIDAELVQHLQGHYGRVARQLIDDGRCTARITKEA